MQRKMKVDSRLHCIVSNGRGSNKDFEIANRTDFRVQFDLAQSPEYPWFPVQVCKNTGRALSGVCNAYMYSKDCVDAIEDGAWNKFDD